jgi:hypothetical protein
MSIWNKELSTTEITELYNSGNGKQYVSSLDSDAQAFIASAAITATTQQNAINTLVTDLKAANIWTKMKAIYPFVGGTAFSCKFNLKDPRDLDVAYRLAPSGGLTYSNLGVLTNGTNSYYFTNIYPNIDLTLNNVHMSIYSNLEFTDTMTDVGLVMGSTDVSYNNRFLGAIGNNNGGSGFQNNDIPSAVNVADTTKLGYYVNTRTSSTSNKLFKNGSLVSTNTTANSKTMPTFQMYLGAWNVGGTARVANRRMATVTIGSGLSDSESVALHNAVQAFNTTLGRAI